MTESNEFYVRLHVDDLTNAVKLDENNVATIDTFIGTVYKFPELDAELSVILSTDYVLEETMAVSTLGSLYVDGELDVVITPPP